MSQVWKGVTVNIWVKFYYTQRQSASNLPHKRFILFLGLALRVGWNCFEAGALESSLRIVLVAQSKVHLVSDHRLIDLLQATMIFHPSHP